MLNGEQPSTPIVGEEEAGLDFEEMIEEIAVSEPNLGEVKDAKWKWKCARH